VRSCEQIIDSIQLGETVQFEKTVTEADVYMFAGVTGDFAPVHVNEEYMKRTRFEGRIAHGVLILGLASTASSQFAARANIPGVSAGYDRVRFLGPVRFGDTIRIDYTLRRKDAERARLYCEVKGINQRNESVLSAEHVIKVIPNGNDSRLT
jgi:3-hydroxybutyryl-CoA dehydratase